MYIYIHIHTRTHTCKYRVSRIYRSRNIQKVLSDFCSIENLFIIDFLNLLMRIKIKKNIERQVEELSKKKIKKNITK